MAGIPCEEGTNTRICRMRPMHSEGSGSFLYFLEDEIFHSNLTSSSTATQELPDEFFSNRDDST